MELDSSSSGAATRLNNRCCTMCTQKNCSPTACNGDTSATESAAVNARGDREVLDDDQVGVLVGLAAQKAGPQQDGDDQPAGEGVTVVATDRIQRPVRGEAATDQQHGQDDGQRKGRYSVEPL